MKISYSEEAIKDLIKLRAFIDVNNPHAARRAFASIKKGISQLKAFPRLGVKVAFAPEPDVVRDLIMGNYLARYLITEKVIYILRIWHHKEETIIK